MATLENDKTKTVKFAEFVVNNPWKVIFASLLITIVATLGGLKLELKTDYRIFFSEDNPQMLAFDDIQDSYDKSDNVMLILTPKEGKVFDRDTLKTIHWVTEKSWTTPYATRVDSVTNYQHTWVTTEDEDYMLVGAMLCIPDKNADIDSECEHPSVTDQMIDQLTDKQLEELAGIATSEPQLVNRIINPSQTVTAINVTVNIPKDVDLETLPEAERAEYKAKVLGAVPKVTKFVRDLKAEIEQRNPNLEVRLSGVIMMNNAFAEVGAQDMMTLTPIMLFLVIPLAIFFMMRSIGGMIGSLIVIIFSITAAMGGAGWTGIFLSGPLFSVPTVVATMAVADSVHLLVTFLQQMRRGVAKKEAMIESIRINMMPIFLTSITTIIGFVTMNFSEVPPLRDMGNTVAMGVAFAYLLSVTFLPAFMMLVPVKHTISEDSKGAQQMDALANFVIEKRRGLLITMLLVSLGLMAALPKNELNDEFIKYFDETVDFRESSDYIAENLTGLYTMFYSIKTNKEDGIHEPKYLRHIQNFIKFTEEQPEVLHVDSYSNTLKRLNKSLNADKPECYSLPEASLEVGCNQVLLEEDEYTLEERLRMLTAQYTIMYENSVPKGMGLTNQITNDKSAIRIQLALENLSSTEVLELETKFNDWFKTNAPELSISASSPAIMFAHVGQRNIYSMIQGTFIALVLISIILAIALRSFKMGLLSLIPNVIPMAVAFGIWGLFKGQVGMGLSVVMGMTLGIVVDDTVHFMSKYLRARREKGLSSEEAVRYAFHTVGMALTVTTIVLVLGFLVLWLSHYVMNSEMGLLTAITLASALIIDFLLLPPLLMLFSKKDNK